MKLQDKEIIIVQTRKWIIDVVIGCNFCPFAAREVKRGTICYEVVEKGTIRFVLEALAAALKKMDDESIETLLLILPGDVSRFDSYLNLVHASEKMLKKNGYEGVFQLASFHPQYLFVGSNEKDPANYTNRSPYPMLQILREESLTLAINNYPDTGKIPEKNIAFAQAKGLAYMKLLREACFA
jgi:hypothetical protein